MPGSWRSLRGVFLTGVGEYFLGGGDVDELLLGGFLLLLGEVVRVPNLRQLTVGLYHLALIRIPATNTPRLPK